VAGQENEVKTIVDFVNAIFNGDARHQAHSLKQVANQGFLSLLQKISWDGKLYQQLRRSGRHEKNVN
jgi:hypothetical protein